MYKKYENILNLFGVKQLILEPTRQIQVPQQLITLFGIVPQQLITLFGINFKRSNC